LNYTLLALEVALLLRLASLACLKLVCCPGRMTSVVEKDRKREGKHKKHNKKKRSRRKKKLL
jgi:hypothetical protein